MTPDPSQSGKLVCKDIMWWRGLELVPQRPKLGLLGKLSHTSVFPFALYAERLNCYNTWKNFFLSLQTGRIWGGSGPRRLLQAQDSLKSLQKFRRQISVTTVSSSTSSIMDEDDEDDGGTYEDSSIDEESYCSEESNTLSTLKSMRKAKRLNSHK